MFFCSFGFVTFSNEWEANKAKNSSDEERTLEGRLKHKLCQIIIDCLIDSRSLPQE